MKILFIPFCNCCSVAKSWLTLWNPMDCSTPGFSVLHYLLEFAQNHVHWVSDAIQPSHPLLHPFPLAFSLSQNQGLFRWAEFLYQVAKVTVYYSISWMYWVSFSLLLLQIISQWIHWTYAIFAIFFPVCLWNSFWKVWLIYVCTSDFTRLRQLSLYRGYAIFYSYHQCVRGQTSLYLSI